MSKTPQAPQSEAQALALLAKVPCADPLTHNIPAELLDMQSWVAYAVQERDGRVTKPPLNPKLDSPRFASVKKPETWGTFGEAMGFLNFHRGEAFTPNGTLAVVAGIGVVLTAETGVDIDHCILPDGSTAEWAKPLVQALLDAGMYAEKSPSGTGIRAFCREPLPPECGTCFKRNGVEAYRERRYLTVTGRRLEGSGSALPEGAKCAEALLLLWKHAYPDAPAPQPKAQGCVLDLNEAGPQTPPPKRPSDCTVDELLDRAFQAKNGAEVKALFSTPPSEAEDKSAVDLQLANRLAFWSGGDAGRLDSMMRKSARLQPPERLAKWDKQHSGAGETYGQLTCAKAIAGCTAFYGSQPFTASTGGGQAQTQAPPPWAQQNAPQTQGAQPEQDAEDEAFSSILPPPPVFPRGIFLPQLEDAIEEVAEKLGSGQYATAAGGCIAALSAAVGGKRMAGVKLSSPQPAALWICNVAPSGVGKTDVVRPFESYLKERNAEAYRQFEQKTKEWRREMKAYNAKTKEEKLAEDAPEAPDYPPMIRMKDTTLEALGDNFRAFQKAGRTPFTAIFSDELRNGLKSLDCYTGGRGGMGLSQLLSLYDGDSWDNARIDKQRCFTIPSCWLSVYGGLQTRLFPKVFTEEMIDSGGFGRWLFTRAEAPEEDPWNDEGLGWTTQETIRRVMTNLLDLPEKGTAPVRAADGGIDLNDQSIVYLTDEAREAQKEWYNAKRRAAYADGTLSLFSKLSKQSSRLALLIHLSGWALLPQGMHPEVIGADTMEKAFRLMEYFKQTQEELLALAKAGKAGASLDARHRKAALVFLRHAGEINAGGGVVSTKAMLAWLKEAGLPITSGKLAGLCKPLGIETAGRLSNTERARRFTPQSFAVMKTVAGIAE